MKRVIFLLFIVMLPISSIADIIHVPGDQPTIQAGIDAAMDGDTVLVADGMYTGEGNRDIDFFGKAITVRSENGAENCIIDCEGSESDPHRGFYFHSGESKDSALDGFTIRHGYRMGVDDPYNYRGGGIYCIGSSPTITNNTIVQNNAGYGGGIYSAGSSPAIMSNMIISNGAHGSMLTGHPGGGGGGIRCSGGSPMLESNHIQGNSAWYSAWGGLNDGWGSGAYFSGANLTVTKNTITENGGLGAGLECSQCSLSIINSTFSGNSQGGILFRDSTVTIDSCTITGNSSCGIYAENGSLTVINSLIIVNDGSGVAGGIFFYGEDLLISNTTIAGNSNGGIEGGGWNSMTVTNTILWGNEGFQLLIDEDEATVTYCNVQGGWPDEGNIDANPLFVSGPLGDYYLGQSPCQPILINPCVDGGDPASDMIEWTTRTDCHPDTGVIDMGYHYPMPVAVTADLSCDPDAGILPFTSQFSVTLGNSVSYNRKVAGRIDVALASGTSFTNWRAGFTNLGPDETYSTSWQQLFPALGSLVGTNHFELHVEDVTPPPFNQPPYPPSGDIDSHLCSINGIEP
jgi:hypothetical protein